jgi:hypothetical protein
MSVGADDAYKLRQVHSATVMMSGSRGKALELFSACKPAIIEFVGRQATEHDLDLDVDRFMADLRRIAAGRKREIIENFVENSIGLKHSEFVKLPTEQYADYWHSIRRLNLGADLLIANVKREAIIVRLDRWGETHWEQNYSAVGEGADIARAMLCLHPWKPAKYHRAKTHPAAVPVPLEECVLRLYEAHVVAHMANPSSVGRAVGYEILTARHRCTTTAKAMEGIERFINNKHKIPQSPEDYVKNAFLQTFQSFDTAVISEEEPDEL